MPEPAQREADGMSTATDHGSTQMKIATLLKPSLLQLNRRSLSTRVSVRVSRPAKVATDERTALERSERLNRYCANTGFPEGGGL